MPIAGLLGGLGPESTIDYYRRILKEWKRAELPGAPSLLIDSLDAHYVLQLVQQNHSALAEYLLESVLRLAAAGADFAAITANTPHIVFDQIASRSPVPLVSIVDVCASEARRRGVTRVALLGTRFTMEAPFYRTAFERHDIDMVPLSEADKAVVHAIYTSELMEGVFREESRQLVHTIVASLNEARPFDAVVLGGTELPILLKTDIVGGVPALNTTALHASAIVARLSAPVTGQTGSADDGEEQKEKRPTLPGTYDPFNGTWCFRRASRNGRCRRRSRGYTRSSPTVNGSTCATRSSTPAAHMPTCRWTRRSTVVSRLSEARRGSTRSSTPGRRRCGSRARR
jgi:aspartate racemase